MNGGCFGSHHIPLDPSPTSPEQGSEAWSDPVSPAWGMELGSAGPEPPPICCQLFPHWGRPFSPLKTTLLP